MGTATDVPESKASTVARAPQFASPSGAGLAVGSQHLLTIRGRISGQPRSTPVSLVLVDGERYVVAALSGADWVKNARAAGEGVMSRGRRTEAVRLVELPVEERGPIRLQEFLRGAGRVQVRRPTPGPDHACVASL